MEPTDKIDPKQEGLIRSIHFIRECWGKYCKMIDKGRSEVPWDAYTTPYLYARLRQEQMELFCSGQVGPPEAIMDECLDVANFAWFIYEQAKGRLIAQQKEAGVKGESNDGV